jgi:hypothetical protein
VPSSLENPKARTPASRAIAATAGFCRLAGSLSSFVATTKAGSALCARKSRSCASSGSSPRRASTITTTARSPVRRVRKPSMSGPHEPRSALLTFA